MSVPSEVVMPPLASTCPSGRRVRFWYERGNAIEAVVRHAGDGAFMSRTAVSARDW
jgi:hypothetical protein